MHDSAVGTPDPRAPLTRYAFYGFLEVRLRTLHKGYLKYFDNEYARIADRVLGAKAVPTVTVEFPRKLPQPGAGDIVRTVRFKNLFTYRFLVRGIESSDVTIFFERHWVDRIYMNAVGVFVQAQVLEPIMYLLFLRKNILFMHAAGVTKNGLGLLLPAYGGTGKTTLSMALLNQGHKLLGDDLLVVDVEREWVYPYARPLHIFTYNVGSLRGAQIPFAARFAVRVKDLLRKPLERILNTELLISTRIHADQIYAGDIFGDDIAIAGIAFLRSTGPAIERVTVTADNVDAIADGIVASADLNDSLAELLGTDSPVLDSARELEHTVVVDLLRKRGKIAYVNTRELDLDSIEAFSDLVV